MRRASLLLFACCLPLLAAGGQVAVSGSVQAPGTYSLRSAGTITRLVQTAGGLTPQAGSAAILRLADSPSVAVTVRLKPVAGRLTADPDLALTAGDRLFVSAAGSETAVIGVQIDGFVRRPGAYPLPLGSRLGDLLQAGGGLLPLANPHARLRRDGGDVAVDLAAAAQARPDLDLPLADGDVLEVASNAAILAPEEARVTISGEIPRPGLYPRYVDMRLSDLLRIAGGLNLGADRERLWLSRLTDAGRVRRLPLRPLDVFAGGPDDVVLQDGDVVTVPGLETIRPGAEPVTVLGEVYYPGSFDLAEGQTVEDLLRLAGGVTPEAWRTRALLTRRGTDGRARQIPLDLSRRPLNLPLAAGDLLEVLSISQAVYTEPRVTILGDVRYPGSYERTLGMRLSDLVWVTGGLTRNIAFIQCEVSRARETSATVIRPDLELALAQHPQHDLELRDGDRVYVRTLGEIRARIPEVHVFGAVRRPGSYGMVTEGDELTDILGRAGGLLPEADPRGAMLLRKVDELVHPDVARYVAELYSGILERQMIKFLSQAASRPGFEKLDELDHAARTLMPELGSELAVALAGSSRRLELPRDAAWLVDRDRLGEFLVDDEGRPIATAKPASQGVRYYRVAIDLPAILAGQASFALRHDDLLILSERAQTVMVMGEVISQQPFLHMAGAPARDYLELCGGLSRDADGKHLLRVLPNGRIQPADPSTVLEAGDVLLAVPQRLRGLGTTYLPKDLARGLAPLLSGLATYLLSLG